MATASTAVLLVAASLLTAANSAASGQKNEKTRAAGKTLTARPLATWQTDGIVWSVEYARGVVYVGGTFGNVRPPGAKPGEKQVPRKNFAAFDAATGALLPCAPAFSGTSSTVRALKASRDGKRLYVGGYFSRAGGTGVASAVALNTADCSLRKDFRPAVSATVRAIDTTDTAVYLGGDFMTVSGRSRHRIAALGPSGSVLPFTADVDAPVRAVLAAPDRGKVIVGGDFHRVNGAPQRALVALDASKGSTAVSYPHWVPEGSAVKALARDDTAFYVGAEGRGVGRFDGRIAGRLSDGTMLWKDDCQGATQALVVYKGALYSGSHAHECRSTPGGFPDGPRHHFLAQSVRDKRILHWFPDTNDGIGEKIGPRALVMAGGILWAGGEFTTVNGRPQQGLTRFGAGPGNAAPEAAPRLTAGSSRAGGVTLTWRAAWDRDDAELTYRIYRDGVLVATMRQQSVAWKRPQMKYTDSVTPGSRHRYTIAVTDGANTLPRSQAVEVTAAAAKRSAGAH
ncbi:fibronectin type III domain-containing protein [Streptomyces carpinensis]|uniref:Fibronectin type III domain-containing protein n=1 Tax=Streptomyces carpinensis TaxID=66369 RepID=A0ABV1W3B2_9ACTN|nr:fibronectin type III domain-containing protein [Streptomyces carpinensis]